MKLLAPVALVLALSAVAQADPVTYSFVNISGNNPANATAGEAQLFVTVSDFAPGQVLFTFFNMGPAACSITDVYFDDGTLLGIASVIDGAGVDFEQGASPGELPAANLASPVFVTTAGFSADSEAPAQPNGVNPGESLGILFDLIGGQVFADTIAALADGSLRIGIHVQGFTDTDGGSEAFVNNGPTEPGTIVPEPHLAVLLALGAAAAALRRRRQKA